jgi:hypothetical protein
MDSNKQHRERKTLTQADRERINLDLTAAAWETKDHEAPPRRPRLSKRPEARPLLDSEAA